MAYTLADIRQRVIEDKLDDTEYDGNIVDRFINDAQKSIFNTYELPFMEKVFVGTLPLNGYLFSFPVDYQQAQALKITDPDDNRRDITDLYIPFRQFNRYFPTPANSEYGAPGAWTLHSNKLYFDRPTDQTYTLELYYLKKPEELEDDTDVPEIPEEFEELLVLGAYIRVLERNEDFDLAAYYKNGAYQEELDKLVGRLGKRQSGNPIVFSQPSRMSVRRSGRH